MGQNFKSVADLFLHRVQATPENPAFSYPEGSEWKKLNWRETGEKVRAIACGLRSLGLSSEDRVAILSGTRIEWLLADLGIMCAGGATSTIYPANTPDECAYILQDSAAVFAFVENQSQLDKLKAEKSKLPGLKNVIIIDGKGDGGWVLTLDELMEKGRTYDKGNPGRYEATISAITPEKLATLIYTSGTTGRAKGVELTHDCWLYEAEGMEGLSLLRPDDLQYLWLPLAHSFGKVLEVGQIRIGFATAVDGRVEKLVENLAVIQPTFIAAVPRIFEKVYNKVVAGATANGGLKASIFKWSVGVGTQVSQLRQRKEEATGFLKFKYGIADKLVFSKLRARFGGRVRFFISGAAPLSRELAEFFHAADIMICEGYGLTETSAASFVNRPGDFVFGSVGKPLPGTQVKIAESDGEILIKGRGVMRGYHHMPQETTETLKDGWLHTGDIGEIDSNGFLRITDRKKDLIKTSGGKYVAPQAIEGKLKLHSRFISQVLVHGNNRNFCVALITINEEEVRPWATQQGFGEKSYGDLAAHDSVRALIAPAVESLNKSLASYESIKKFALLPAELTVETGELTASLKIKRKHVEQKYKDVLEKFYEGSVQAM